MDYSTFVERSAKAVDLAGVVFIIAGALAATAFFLSSLRRREDFNATYTSFRHNLGRAILLGLELLVGADIIHTVAITPTFHSAGVLAVIVIIRTFLSTTIDLEMSGHWPWQRPQRPPPV